MLLRNVFHSTSLPIRPRRHLLPSLRKLGSRLLNAIVILAMILPNGAAAQAIVVEGDLNGCHV